MEVLKVYELIVRLRISIPNRRGLPRRYRPILVPTSSTKGPVWFKIGSYWYKLPRTEKGIWQTQIL